MLFKRKNEFRPDKIHSGALNQLYITPKQRRAFLKWFLMGLILTLTCVLQDTTLSQITLFNGGFDLVPALILLACVLQDPETGGGFTLAAAIFYWCFRFRTGDLCHCLPGFVGRLFRDRASLLSP